VSSVFFYSLLLISLIDTNPSPTAAHLSTWIVSGILEILLLGASVALYTSRHYDHYVNKKGDVLRNGPSMWEVTELIIDVCRVTLLVTLIGLYIVFVTLRDWRSPRMLENGHGSGETVSLLHGPHADGESANEPNGVSYGSTLNSPREPHQSHKEEPAGWARPTTLPSKNWWEYIRGYTLFFPYLWPSKSRRLQIVMIICFLLVTLQRGINVLVPHQLGVVTNILSGEDGNEPRLPWVEIFLYVFYRFMQGNMGVLGAVRSYLWIPIGQYSYQSLSTSAFEHVHSLSLDFHLGKRTGEVLSALSKGNSINTFLEQVTFQVVPMLVDLGVAVAYFLVVFDAYFALVVAIITFCYLYITIRMAQWRADIRRQMVNASREEDAVKYVPSTAAAAAAAAAATVPFSNFLLTIRIQERLNGLL
jgi:ATP-binding cassette, subfamily B, vacuolar membrane transporter HMT1/ACLQ